MNLKERAEKLKIDIPVIGYLDDLIILPALIALTLKFIPPQVMERCRKESENMWKDGKPKKWYFAIPFVLIWILILTSILKKLL